MFANKTPWRYSSSKIEKNRIKHLLKLLICCGKFTQNSFSISRYFWILYWFERIDILFYSTTSLYFTKKDKFVNESIELSISCAKEFPHYRYSIVCSFGWVGKPSICNFVQLTDNFVSMLTFGKHYFQTFSQQTTFRSKVNKS